MKRSLQEIVELIIFGLIALVVGTGLLWVFGWLFGIVGVLFKFVAGLIWILLRYILPVAIAAAVIFFVVRFFVNRSQNTPSSSESPGASGSTHSHTSVSEKLEQISENVSEGTHNLAEAVTETSTELKELVSESVQESKEHVDQLAREVKEQAKEKLSQTQELASELKEQVHELIDETPESTENTPKKPDEPTS